jgi:hypothetical protein
MSDKPQNYAHHTKYDPAFHFFLLPVLLTNIILAAIHLFRAPGFPAVWFLVVSLALLVMALRVRLYATFLQDRIIRTEERLHLAQVLAEPLRSRIGELTVPQLIGLRFASDAELPVLVTRALDEKLDRASIKKAITNWRADNLRV